MNTKNENKSGARQISANATENIATQADNELSLLVITGLSGAGKTLVLRKLEDMGYYCADNLPSKLLPDFVEQCKSALPMIALAAVVIDSREAAFGVDWDKTLTMLKALDVKYKIIFLECNTDILLRRYSETRRKHPLVIDGDISGAIMRERMLLQGLREHAHAVIDTSNTTPMELNKKLDDVLEINPAGGIVLLFVSFGFKRGLPIDTDMVFDMRFLPNPFYDPELRGFSGADEPVKTYLEEQDDILPFFNTVENILNLTLPGFIKQGKQRVMVAFGCTGGRHRSVYAAEEMFKRFEGGPYNVKCVHRDYRDEGKGIEERFGPEDTGPEGAGQRDNK